jgi:non-specific serine/threonine protein kinase
MEGGALAFNRMVARATGSPAVAPVSARSARMSTATAAPAARPVPPTFARNVTAGTATRSGGAAPRVIGPWEIVALVGRSEATMAFRARDRRPDGHGREVTLCMPRDEPAGTEALEDWDREARRAARLDHPNLAPTREIGVHEGWPWVAVDRAHGIPLDEWLATAGSPALEQQATLAAEVLRGLAFAHDASVVHGDVQRWHVLIDERGAARLAGLAVASPAAPRSAVRPGGWSAGHGAVAAQGLRGAAHVPLAADTRNLRGLALDPAALRRRRDTAERDVLATGLLLHELLAGRPALDEPDIGRALGRMTPLGREIVRLPWTTPTPIPEALRAIANRAASSQVRLRYRSPRTFAQALDGWLAARDAEEGGPVGLLLDRLRTVGHLPALPGLAQRVQRVTAIEGTRTHEIAQHLLPDTALAFELVRTMHTAAVQGTQIADNGPVLTLRRVVALIGVDGVRAAANSLRMWPGPLDNAQAPRLAALLERVRLAGHVAQALRPAGYDAEAIYLVAVLQNLGRLMLGYHFADEYEQIRELMRPASAVDTASSGVPDGQPGLDEDAACWAVLGVDLDALAGAVVRHWGLTQDLQPLIRRVPLDQAVHRADDDEHLLRQIASAANETVDALHTLPAARLQDGLSRIAQRYARTAKLDVKILHDAVVDARQALRGESTAPTEPGVQGQAGLVGAP